LLGFPQVQLLQIARHPSVGDVDEHQGGPALVGELLCVIEDGDVGPRVLEGNQDLLEHQFPPLRMSTRSQAFSAKIRNPAPYARTLTHGGFTNSPILARSDVKRISG